MADDKIIQHSHYKEEPVPRLEEAQLSYPQWLTKMHQIYRGEDPPEVPASITTSVDAFVNAGRWLWECIACNNATVCEVGQPSICVECATQGWVNVVFPSNREQVETELLKQPGHRAHSPIRQWHPGWGMSVLEDRTTRAQAAVDAGMPFPTSLSIGATRIWSVGEILTAANKNTYERTVLEDLAGRNGPVEYEDAIVIDSLTTMERDAITLTGTGGLGASGNGLVIYNSTKSVFERYENGAWREFTDLASLTISGAAQGDVFIRGASAIERLGAGTARQLFRTGGTGANPSWNDLVGTKIAGTTTQGSVLYEDSNGRVARLAASTTAGKVVRSQGANANPVWGSSDVVLTEYTTVGTHTYTPPTGSRFLFVEAVAGGGGGGGGASYWSGGGGRTAHGGVGGTGGQRVRSTGIGFWYPVAATFTVVVGSGGAGGAGAAAPTVSGTGNNGTGGTAGGNTTFGAGTSLYVGANLGPGGAGGGFTSSRVGAAGAAGANGTTGRGGGGGGGGSVESSTKTFNGGAGGSTTRPTTAGGAGGTSTSRRGGNGSAAATGAGSGGGGAEGGTSKAGAAGGAGGAPGGAGGGGSGGMRITTGQNQNGGNGQNGKGGRVRIWAW